MNRTITQTYKHTPVYSKTTSYASNRCKKTIVGSCLAILGLGGTVVSHGQENIDPTAGSYITPDNVRLCNESTYVKKDNDYYQVKARHCVTGISGSKVVTGRDIIYKKVSNPIGAQIMNILNKFSVENGELHNKSVTIHLRVYNLDGDARNQYYKPFTAMAQYDSYRKMYFIQIPIDILRWYTENVSAYDKHRMRSSSGSGVVNCDGTFVGVVSGSRYDPKDHRGFLYFAPTKDKIEDYTS